MLRPAFSTVACPNWTLDRVCRSAAEWGYAAVELRSFGHGGLTGGSDGAAFANDPGLTDADKVRRLVEDSGLDLACVATGCSFDDPIVPPVIGYRLPFQHRPLLEAKHLLDVSVACGAAYMRVFAFEVPGRESRRSALRRITDRLAELCTHARHRGTKVVIQNGGGFPRAADLAEIIDIVGSPFLDACYDLAPAAAVGESHTDAIRLLNGRLPIVHIRQTRGGEPTPLTEVTATNGDLPIAEFLADLAATGSSAFAVYQWDRAWRPDLAPAEAVLPEAVKAMYRAAADGAGRAAA
ncbi:MAG: sugar phosphate isomerase/epimerase [Phycisphaerales bacterium]|nr:sugar phosphate isomerase/epimerase [Phycisphaerales bacterium]